MDLLERYKKRPTKCSKLIKKAKKLFQQQQSESQMTKDENNFFKYVRKKQNPSFSQTHTIPEPSELNLFSTSIGGKMESKNKDSSEPVSGKHVKNRYSFFTQQLPRISTFDQISKSQFPRGTIVFRTISSSLSIPFCQTL